MIIFVLHGFQGATPNRKTEVLRKYATPHIVVGLNYEYEPKKALCSLIQQVACAKEYHNCRDIVFLGTSLGAFWAKYLAFYFGVGGILINPALDPLASLVPHIGMNNNVVTNGAFVLSSSDIEKYEEYYVEDNGHKLLVLLDKGDELLDYNVSYDRFRLDHTCLVWEEGNHSFAHLKESLPDIFEFIEGEKPEADDPRLVKLFKKK